jgi:hypothetical protein
VAEQKQWPPASDPELELVLRRLGEQIAYPPTPPLAAAMRRSLLAPGRRQPARWRQFAVALAAIVIAVLLLAASPALRTAVAGRLGLRGITIHQVPVVPTAPTALPLPAVAPAAATALPQPTAAPTATSVPVGERLHLGERLAVAQGAQRVAFPVLIPAALGPPDEVYVLLETDTAAPGTSPAPPGGLVTLVYRPRPNLPAVAETGVGLLLGEFQGSTDQVFISKMAGPGTQIVPVSVAGQPGFWLTGQPHEFLYRDAGGVAHQQTLRLAGNTLIWERGDLTLRLEAGVDEATALRIAASVR